MRGPQHLADSSKCDSSGGLTTKSRKPARTCPVHGILCPLPCSLNISGLRISKAVSQAVRVAAPQSLNERWAGRHNSRVVLGVWLKICTGSIWQVTASNLWTVLSEAGTSNIPGCVLIYVHTHTHTHTHAHNSQHELPTFSDRTSVLYVELRCCFYRLSSKLTQPTERGHGPHMSDNLHALGHSRSQRMAPWSSKPPSVRSPAPLQSASSMGNLPTFSLDPQADSKKGHLIARLHRTAHGAAYTLQAHLQRRKQRATTRPWRVGAAPCAPRTRLHTSAWADPWHGHDNLLSVRRNAGELSSWPCPGCRRFWQPVRPCRGNGGMACAESDSARAGCVKSQEPGQQTGPS